MTTKKQTKATKRTQKPEPKQPEPKQPDASTPNEGEKEKPKSRSVVPVTYKQRYGKNGNNGDELARKLLGYDALEVGRLNDVNVDKWAHLNPGMCRMNTGNVLRRKWRHGDDLRFPDGSVLKGQPQKEEAAK